jgi:hypothetical protein
MKHLALILPMLTFQASCKPKTIDGSLNEVKAAGVDSELFSPWDFTYQLQSGAEDDSPNLLDASQFMAPEVFSKVASYILLEAKVSESKSDEQIIASSAGKFNKFRNEGLDTCMKGIQNWKVKTIRIAPYESVLPGDQKGLNRILQKKNPSFKGNQVPVIRLVVNPYCNGRFQDAAMHLVYSSAIPAEIRLSLLKSVVDFRTAAASGQEKAAENVLHQYGATLASPEFQAYRKKFIENLLPLVAHRRSLGEARYKFLNQVILPKIGSKSRTSFDTGGNFLGDEGAANNRILTSPGFESLDGSGYKVLKQFMNLELKKENLVNVAIFSIADFRSMWFFGLTDSTGKPIPIQSNALIESPNGVKLSPIRRTGFLADTSMTTEFDSSNSSIKNQELFSKFDLFDPGQSGTLDFFQAQNAILNQKLPILLDPEATSTATTSCASCHLLSNTRIIDGKAIVGETEPQSNFHMTTFLGQGSIISSRMIAEVLHEAKLLNLEASAKGIKLAQSEVRPSSPVTVPSSQVAVPASASSAAIPCVVQSNDGDDFMNVRPEPNTVKKEIGRANNGHQVMKIGTSGGWAKVQIRIPPGSEPLRVGFISEKGLKCNTK